MSPALRLLLDGVLAANPVFVTLLGALLAAVEPQRAHTALIPAVRFGTVFAVVAATGGLLAATLPPVLQPLVVLAGTATGVGLLTAWGELQGDWAGLPKALLSLAPLAGLQIGIARLPGVAEAVAAATGGGLGFAWAFVALGAIRATARTAECDPRFKTTPFILFAMGLFALALYGFIVL